MYFVKVIGDCGPLGTRDILLAGMLDDSLQSPCTPISAVQVMYSGRDSYCASRAGLGAVYCLPRRLSISNWSKRSATPAIASSKLAPKHHEEAPSYPAPHSLPIIYTPSHRHHVPYRPRTLRAQPRPSQHPSSWIHRCAESHLNPLRNDKNIRTIGALRRGEERVCIWLGIGTGRGDG